MNTYYFYILRCSDNSPYCGTTNNLKNRIKQHNSGEGAKYTKIHKPVKLVYYEKFLTLEEARQREKQIKGWIRVKKENLIKYGHPNNIKSENYSRIN